MNQILITEQVKEKNTFENQKKQKMPKEKGGEIEIKSIVRFFSIAIIILGIAISGGGAYSLAQNIKLNNEKIMPTVQDVRSGNSINLMVSSEIGIKSVIYSWNDSTETIISGKNKTEVNQTIKIMSGNNKLNITVIDSKDNITKYVKNYIQAEKDTTEPEIFITNEDPKVKIKVTDDTKLDYIVYKYGDNDEKKVFADEENPTEIEVYIDDLEKTETLLKVEAVDKCQNVKTEQIKVKGSLKPTATITQDPVDPSYIIIKAIDDEGLRMVSFYIGEQLYQTDPNTSYNGKEFEYRIQINPGENKVSVHAYNLNGQVSEVEGTYSY